MLKVQTATVPKKDKKISDILFFCIGTGNDLVQKM